jgi:hypothetical protein
MQNSTAIYKRATCFALIRAPLVLLKYIKEVSCISVVLRSFTVVFIYFVQFILSEYSQTKGYLPVRLSGNNFHIEHNMDHRHRLETKLQLIRKYRIVSYRISHKISHSIGA